MQRKVREKFTVVQTEFCYQKLCTAPYALTVLYSERKMGQEEEQEEMVKHS